MVIFHSYVSLPEDIFLLGGFHHLEKYESQLEGLSHILWKFMENKTCSKPPTSQWLCRFVMTCNDESVHNKGLFGETSIYFWFFGVPGAKIGVGSAEKEIWLMVTNNPWWFVRFILVGGIPNYPSEKYESQLGWWHSQYMEKIKAMFQTTNQSLTWNMTFWGWSPL